MRQNPRWTINVVQWAMAMMGGQMGAMIRQVPPGLPEARTRGLQLLSEIQALAGGLPMSKIVIGGFSQGAMTAVDLALQLPAGGEQAGGIMALSGAPIVVDEWAAKLAQIDGAAKPAVRWPIDRPLFQRARADLFLLRSTRDNGVISTSQVLVTHGTNDPVLPFVVGNWLKDLLATCGCQVQFEQHGGGHELGPAHIVDAMATFWADVAARGAADDSQPAAAGGGGVSVAGGVTDASSAASARAAVTDADDDEAELAKALLLSMES